MQDYGHPCSGGQQQMVDETSTADDGTAATLTDTQEQGLTAEQFIQLFIHWLS